METETNNNKTSPTSKVSGKYNIEHLRELALNVNWQAVLTCLEGTPKKRISHIAKAVGISKEATVEALEALEDRGFIKSTTSGYLASSELIDISESTIGRTNTVDNFLRVNALVTGNMRKPDYITASEAFVLNLSYENQKALYTEIKSVLNKYANQPGDSRIVALSFGFSNLATETEIKELHS